MLPPGLASWDRAWAAAVAIERRARRFSALLDAARLDHAIVGGVAAAAWVCTVDEAGFRTSNDVDVLLRRADLARVREAVLPAGFVFQDDPRPLFVDGLDCPAMMGVKVVFAGEPVRAGDLLPAPDVAESERVGDLRVLRLEPLVRTMLVSDRNEEGMLLRDLLGVGLIDATWPARFPPDLAARLQHVLDTPDG
jgi:hypothetical protein